LDYRVETITWKKDNIDELYQRGKATDAILVWVNPLDRMIENGLFENFLISIHGEKKYVSNRPDVVLKIGTKKVLHDLSGTQWISDTYCHEDAASFSSIAARLDGGSPRVLKQYRGNGGIGVYKIYKTFDGLYELLEATSNNAVRHASIGDIARAVAGGIGKDNPIIEVPWNEHLRNGMVRCYFCAGTVAGFGYQEINALYPDRLPGFIKKERFYVTEKCGIFSNLKQMVEAELVPDLLLRQKVDVDSLPLIWDADFFINGFDGENYELCEINASCVSPFPPSAIPYMCEEIKKRI